MYKPRTDRGGDGAEIIYALRNSDDFSKLIARELENANQNVRKYYQRRLPSNPAKDYYYILRDTPDNETVIVEYGFADSKGDDILLLKNNWQDLAEAVTKAIVQYAGGIYEAPVGSTYYTVQAGDTLWSIANNYNISVEDLKKTNNLVSNLLSIGQNLLIPSLLPELQEYVVQKGDTLYSIANKYSTTVDNLKSINNLVTDSLSIGQIIKLPQTSSPNEEIEEQVNENIYIVQSGDTLYSIANKYNTTVDALISLNNLKSNNISINQALLIPVSDQVIPLTYTVSKGDSLYSIARKFNTTVDRIKELNNLKSNLLSIGQVLIVS